MKREKIQAALVDNTMRIAEAKFGEPVLHGTDMLMRVKPVNFLCNSTVITDVLARGDVLVVNTDKGTCYAMAGDTPVKRVISKLLWSEE